MRVVLDINVLLISLPVASKYRPIFDAIKNGRFTLLVTNEILTEYEEMIGQKTTRPEIATNVTRLLLNLSNVEKIYNIYYRWGFIVNDPDDNKYPDCAIVGNAHLIVSNDGDFNVLKSIPFPIFNVLNADEFLKLIQTGII